GINKPRITRITRILIRLIRAIRGSFSLRLKFDGKIATGRKPQVDPVTSREIARYRRHRHDGHSCRLRWKHVKMPRLDRAGGLHDRLRRSVQLENRLHAGRDGADIVNPKHIPLELEVACPTLNQARV